VLQHHDLDNMSRWWCACFVTKLLLGVSVNALLLALILSSAPALVKQALLAFKGLMFFIMQLECPVLCPPSSILLTSCLSNVVVL